MTVVVKESPLVHHSAHIKPIGSARQAGNSLGTRGGQAGAVGVHPVGHGQDVIAIRVTAFGDKDL